MPGPESKCNRSHEQRHPGEHGNHLKRAASDHQVIDRHDQVFRQRDGGEQLEQPFPQMDLRIKNMPDYTPHVHFPAAATARITPEPDHFH